MHAIVSAVLSETTSDHLLAWPTFTPEFLLNTLVR